MSKSTPLVCPVQRRARVQPHTPAIITPDAQWTYAQLGRAIAATAKRLREADIRRGARVALHLPRTADAVVLLWAVWRVRAVAIPLNRRWPAGTAVEFATEVGATDCVTDDAAVAQASRETFRIHALQALVEPASSAPSDPGSLVPMALDQPVTLVFTSGSTGTPKAALHTWRNHVASALGSNANIPVEPGNRWLLSLPLYHVGGIAVLVRCALGGGAVVVPSSAASLADRLATAAVTHASLVSTQLRRLLHADATHPARMAALLVGGGAVPQGLLDAAHDRGWPLHTTYGCTEMASQVTTTPPDASLETLTTAGRVLPHRRLRIADDGEILVAGKTLFRGYVRGDTVHDPRDENGWFHTGDVGTLDAHGRLRIEGRKDHMFISGGENVQPEIIEAELEALPGVERAIVVPIEDAEYGHRPVAFLQMHDASLRAERLSQQLATTLPGFMIPDAFLPLPDDSSTGLKTDRAALRDRARVRLRP